MLAPREIQRATDEVIFEEYAFQAAVVAPPPVLAVRAPPEIHEFMFINSRPCRDIALGHLICAFAQVFPCF